MPTTAHKKHLIGTGGPWGTGLLLLGVGCVMQGVGYIFGDEDGLPPALAFLAATVPIWAWGALWMVAGLSAAYRALTPPQKHADVWPVVGITLLWTFVYLFHYLVGVVTEGDWGNRSWAGAVAWFCLASVITCMGRCVNPPSRNP